MKKLIFLDNDRAERANEDVDYVKNNLEYAAKLSAKYLNTMEVLPDFAHEDKDKMMDMLFSGEYAICTWSMYTATHYGSLFQMLGFLKTAAISEVKGIIYIDGSGNFQKDIGRYLRDYKDAMPILNAVEANYIISFEDNECFRLRVDIKGLYESPFKREKVNLKKLLTTCH